MMTMRNVCAAVFLAGMAAMPVTAQQPATAAADSLRDRLAAGYLRLELALRDATAAGVPVPGSERRRLNQAFDALTLQFFGGNLQGALASLDALVASVAADGAAIALLEQRAASTLAWLTEQRQMMETGTGVATPYLIHVPERDAPKGGWPVIVAVHGAGGDERMFFGGYGAGVIRDLADTHGLAVITPRAPLATAALVALVDSVAARHPLDAERVALLGHSMGAGVVARAAIEMPQRFRAVVCLAGSCGAGAMAATGPAVLMIAGALDPLFRSDMLEAQAEAMRQAGRRVEFRRLDDEGHTLMAGAALPDAVRWLADRLSRPEPVTGVR
jgi:phospholipase/carboxylesterase